MDWKNKETLKEKETSLTAVIFKSFHVECCLMIAKDSYLKRRIVMPTLAFFEFVGVVKLVGGQ